MDYSGRGEGEGGHLIPLVCVRVCVEGTTGGRTKELSLIDRNNATANRDRLESGGEFPLIRSRSNDAAWIYCGHRSFLLIEWPMQLARIYIRIYADTIAFLLRLLFWAFWYFFLFFNDTCVQSGVSLLLGTYRFDIRML